MSLTEQTNQTSVNDFTEGKKSSLAFFREITPLKIVIVMLYATVAIAPLLMLNFILNNSVNMIYHDEWATIRYFQTIHSGTFNIAELWLTHNEHRIVTARILILALAWLNGGWDTRLELISSWFLCVACLVLIWHLLHQSKINGKPWTTILLTLIFSFLLFSAAQGNNWSWGFQVCWFLTDFFMILTIWALNRGREHNRWRWFAFGAAGAVLATISLASGMVIWVGGAISFLSLNWKSRRFKQFAIWLGVAGLTIGAYFVDYRTPKNTLDVTSRLQDPLSFAEQLITVLGLPLTVWADKIWLTVTGGVGLIIFGLIVGSVTLRFFKARKTRTEFDLTAYIPWLQFWLIGLLSAFLITVGRGQTNQAGLLGFKYNNLINFFWVGLIGLFALELSFIYRSWRRTWLQRGFVIALCTLLVGVFCYGVLRSHQAGSVETQIAAQDQLGTLPILFKYKEASDSELRRFFHNPPAVRNWAEALDKQQIGPFRPGYREQFASEQQKAHQNLSAILEQRQKYSITFPQRYIAVNVVGNNATLKVTKEQLKFTPQKQLPKVDVFVNFQTMPFAAITKDGYVEFKIQKPAYVGYIWNLGTKLGDAYNISYGYAAEDGWRYYRQKLPTNALAVRMDIYYLMDNPEEDTLFLNFYGSENPKP